MLRIVVNGEDRELPEPCTLADLLTAMAMPTRGVAVEVNEQIVPRSQHATRLVTDGDRLEVVTLVGGG